VIGEAIPILAVLTLGIIVLVGLQRTGTPRERTVMGLSYAAHVLAAFVQVWVTQYVYGYGDMLTYHYHGVELAHLMRYDFWDFAPEVVRLVLHQEAMLPYDVTGAGSSTGAMTGIAGLLCFLLNDSLYASCLLLGTLSFLGKLALYYGLRNRLEPELHGRALYGVMLVPSAIFWTSGLLKESIAMIGLGPMAYGLLCFGKHRPVASVAGILGGAVIVGLAKAYVLFGFALAAGVWVYWTQSMGRSGGRPVTIRPLYLVLAVAVALGGVVALGRFFPQYAMDSVVQQTASLQSIGARVEGGSNYQIAETPTRSLGGQLGYAPLALVTALFRPSLPEVRNPLMLVNALETTLLLLLFVRALVQLSWAELWRRFRSSGVIAFCATFTVVMAISVGLATTNLGTLSRYRTPFMPFFMTLLLVWTAPAIMKVVGPSTTSSRAARPLNATRIR
jgi:hypothetical protein